MMREVESENIVRLEFTKLLCGESAEPEWSGVGFKRWEKMSAVPIAYCKYTRHSNEMLTKNNPILISQP